MLCCQKNGQQLSVALMKLRQFHFFRSRENNKGWKKKYCMRQKNPRGSPLFNFEAKYGALSPAERQPGEFQKTRPPVQVQS
jgi:hypothetical protein